MSETDLDRKVPDEPDVSKIPPQLRATTFPKGVSGNPSGRPKGRSLSRILRDVAEERKIALVEAQYAKALEGNQAAAEWVARHSGEGAGTPQVAVNTSAFTIKIGVPTGDDDAEVTDELGADEREEIEAITEAAALITPADEAATDDLAGALPESVKALIAAVHPEPPAPTPRRKPTAEERWWSEG